MAAGKAVTFVIIRPAHGSGARRSRASTKPTVAATRLTVDP